MAMMVPDPDDMMDYRVIDDPTSDGMNGNEAEAFYGASAVEVDIKPRKSTEDEDELKPTLEGINVDTSDPSIITFLTTTFKGQALLRRLDHLVNVCPQLRAEAYLAMIDYITTSTNDVTSYMALYNDLSKRRGGNVDLVQKPEPFTLDGHVIPAYNTVWATTTTTAGINNIDAMQAEYKRQKDEGVKESTRRALHELIRAYVDMGRIPEAITLYSRGMREYCTSFKHVVEMLLEWMTLALHAGSGYHYRLEQLLSQAERAIAEARESTEAKAKQGAAPTPPQGSPGGTVVNIKQLIDESQCKITILSALHHLINSRKYRDVAQKLINVSFDVFDSSDLMSANDVAIYGTICALATFSRTELKERILNNMEFRKFMECDQRLVDVVKKFISSDFSAVMDLLNGFKNELQLNIYIAAHVNKLYSLIRKEAIRLYFFPFSNANIRTMAEVFQTTPEGMIEELAELIFMKAIDARINAETMEVTVNRYHKRGKTHEKTLECTDYVEAMTNAILLRGWMQRDALVLGDGKELKATRRRPIEDPDESDSAGYNAMDY
uniref:PCI domain-containing protein n=1 Tax=Steinernema glaseri TaxID=37863 RepID=A0A1I7YDH1_9BILA